ncbi:SRPBCC family protein [Oceanisphaera arctica]|uniref:SRPBCC family protein n=1 Tax=Oceanisphaera arctica TaxID=641510 RepID=UPI0016751D5A|nr:SRPBCC family protein [Oceanisphaera arctica]GHA19178.1 polyketide cyclase [Oceanisphaera arctica]
MANYDFMTRWEMPAPMEEVYRAIGQPLHWPHWWQGLRRVEALGSYNERGTGRVYRYHWRSPLGYSLCFDIRVTRLYAPWLIVGQASGDVEGWGCWQLSEAAGITRVRYRWRVRTTRRWMNLTAPLARPLFVWSHDAMMHNGALGLSRWLQARQLNGGRR